MTNEEAIKELGTIMWNVKGYTAEIQLEALTIAVKALEKQIPKKVIPLNDEWWDYQCPTCGCKFAESADYDYCPDCGQRLEGI